MVRTLKILDKHLLSDKINGVYAVEVIAVSPVWANSFIGCPPLTDKSDKIQVTMTGNQLNLRFVGTHRLDLKTVLEN